MAKTLPIKQEKSNNGVQSRRSSLKSTIMDQSGAGKTKIGELLCKEGYITGTHLEDAINYQKKNNGRLGNILVKLGYIDEDTIVNVKSSVYLSKQLGHSYGYLSNLFSEITYSSIENFIIIQKIEYSKHLLLNTELNLTEIAFKLNYSSVAHLSTQFKNTTGITPSAFQRIIFKRREIAQQKTHDI